MSVDVDLCRSMWPFHCAFGWHFYLGQAFEQKDPFFLNCGRVASWVEADELPGKGLLCGIGQLLACLAHRSLDSQYGRRHVVNIAVTIHFLMALGQLSCPMAGVSSIAW